MRDASIPVAQTADLVRLLDLIGAAWSTQVVGVAAELRIADLLSGPAQSVADLARITGCDTAALHRLLRALVTLGLCCELGDGVFTVTGSGTLLREHARPGAHAWAIWWSRHLWPTWAGLLDSVRTGRSARERATGRGVYAHIESNGTTAQVFNRAMSDLSQPVCADIAARVDLASAHTVVDIGGGHGDLLGAILLAHPALRGVLLELPHAVAGATAQLQALGLASRCEVIVGSFFEEVPGKADVYIMKSVLHNWDDAACGCILRACRRAMSVATRLVVIERVFPDGAQPTSADQRMARADLNMLVGLGGRERSQLEFAQLFAAQGLRIDSICETESEFSLLTAVTV